MHHQTVVGSRLTLHQLWHDIPLTIGCLALICSFTVFCPEQSCAYPSSFLVDAESRVTLQICNILLVQIIAFIFFALPCGLMAIACFLQSFEMDNLYLNELKKYKNEGVTVDGVLAEPPNNNKSKFLTKYQYEQTLVTKVIKVSNEREKDKLLTDSSFPLVVLPSNVCSAIARSWLDEQIQDRSSSKRRAVHFAVAIYGLAFYFGVPQVFLVYDPRNPTLLCAFLALSTPAVRRFLLQRHSASHNYLQLTDHAVASYGVPLAHAL